MRTALAQINPTVGDIQGNIALMDTSLRKARQAHVNLLIFPEMCVCGYPPEDLLHKKHFLADTKNALDRFASQCKDITVMAGFAEPAGDECYNSLAVMQQGKIRTIYRKNRLPNYEVFDERRYFTSGGQPVVIEINNIKIALTICEDLWELDWLDKFLAPAPKPDLIVNISASPFYAGKIVRRQQIINQTATHFSAAVAYCNMIGGQDELVFDGRSMFVDPLGNISSRAKAFQEDLLIADLAIENGKTRITPDPAYTIQTNEIDQVEEIYNALVLGTRDYVRKNGFGRVVIGMSGGIDSSLTAAIAVEALGAENVVGITMPSRFNSTETISDAQKSAENLGMEFHTIAIADILDGFDKSLQLMTGWDDKGLAFENLQARIRGTILMSLSNQFGYLVLTTGNKSETAVGYSTLYGDTAGGFAVIKDVPKTMVYRLSKYINDIKNAEIIPTSVIERPPSAELRPDQKDSDSLPDYDLLDEILKGFVEDDLSSEELIARELDPTEVKRIVRLVDRNEYKRRQCPPGIKITPKAFGKDRRMPITNRYKSG